METSDMGETSFRSLIEGDGKYRRDEEDFGKTRLYNSGVPGRGTCK